MLVLQATSTLIVELQEREARQVMTLFNNVFGRQSAQEQARAARQQQQAFGQQTAMQQAFGQQPAMQHINSSLLREIHDLQVDNSNLRYKIYELEHRLKTPPDEEVKKLKATHK